MKKNFQRNKNISKIFTILALILSHIMFFVVAWNYRDMLCGIVHGSYSAPAEMAFLTAIPYAVVYCFGMIIKNLRNNIRFIQRTERIFIELSLNCENIG